MISTIIDILYNAILNVIGWFTRIHDHLGSWQYIFGAVAVMLVVRFIIYPFLKEGIVSGSDGARKKKNG